MLDDIQSIYLWGAPGCGKSWIMEQFFEQLDIPEKNFLHYHEFMLKIHEKEHIINRKLKGKS